MPAKIFVSEPLEKQLRDEIQQQEGSEESSFISSLQQLCNVAALPGIVQYSIGLPDIHSGYGFSIGNVAAFDMDDPSAIVSPGGVGFDINCGVRMLRTNLDEGDVREKQDELASLLFERVPVGVNGKSEITLQLSQIDEILERGMTWAVDNKYAWDEDIQFCEENGCIKSANKKFVGQRAKRRGIAQVGTLGAGNHYVEIQAVDEIYDWEAAKAMGISRIGQVCLMIHCGSRGLGHQVASDFLKEIEKCPSRIEVNDRQLACTPIQSRLGSEYLGAMAAAANFAFVNRSVLATLVRECFEKVFGESAMDLDMSLIYDVAHNIAKMEKHQVDGKEMNLLVHRKGATRAFGPDHPELPAAYKSIGQPVLVGGSMGTHSYVLTGTTKAMKETFGSTCHGAGRALSRSNARKTLSYQEINDDLVAKGILLKAKCEHSIGEEAPQSYKDVSEVIQICHDVGISSKSFRLKPLIVIKG